MMHATARVLQYGCAAIPATQEPRLGKDAVYSARGLRRMSPPNPQHLRVTMFEDGCLVDQRTVAGFNPAGSPVIPGALLEGVW